MRKVYRRITEAVKAFLLSRHRAYLLTFPLNSLAVQAVMKDLAQFCRAQETTFHQDPRVHAALEGRREVWLRIWHHLGSSPDEFLSHYGSTEAMSE